MCEMCRTDLHHGFAPTRRDLLLGASAMGLLWAGGATAKEKDKERPRTSKTKAPPKPENVDLAGRVAQAPDGRQCALCRRRVTAA